ncbi:MAG: cell division protein FtsZ, partial [Anaerolineales bacterium]|nr:cell division protein FtsZ [Anaerolineales bacterium]
ETAHPDVNMIFGAVIDPEMGDEIRCTVIATGFERSGIPRRALERIPRTNDKPASLPIAFPRTTESVSVSADYKPASSDVKSTPTPSINSDDLDVPTFLRNRR